MRSVLDPNNKVAHLYTTVELIEIVRSNANKEIEARLILSGCLATHFLQLKGKWLYDMGIDSEIVKTTTDELLQRYPSHEWILDQII